MSNPFATDEYGRPKNSRHPLPPDSAKSTLSSTHEYITSKQMQNRSKRYDHYILGFISVVMVLLAFLALVIMIKNISPNAPTRLTPAVPETTNQQNEQTDNNEADLLGD